jgi:hypothetical protein
MADRARGGQQPVGRLKSARGGMIAGRCTVCMSDDARGTDSVSAVRRARTPYTMDTRSMTVVPVSVLVVIFKFKPQSLLTQRVLATIDHMTYRLRLRQNESHSSSGLTSSAEAPANWGSMQYVHAACS